jgi:predicted DsbA family dithiol-disulfide isomerase
VCPWCYIGKRRLERARSRPQTDLEIIWRPFFLNPDMPPEGPRPRRIHRAQIRRERARGPHLFERGGSRRNRGYPVRFDLIKRSPNTVDSHRLIHFAELMQRQNEWSRGLSRLLPRGTDIGDQDVLADLAAQTGIPRDDAARYLQSGADRDVVVAGDERARAFGA